ncbi:type 4a pilus biogenesis protein PilO [Thalassotalea ponticola]|uniref:type 4a pilus biogenesis protein PilO n=1 Tax=Thalassotalea ponticola TaxID=1523392 RepID=UPI0025B47E79|nr:type 4a pilus biogenesis protein PilO [Thalassotalea ponticola]MDN3652854.1 type 4a pilus biogenesis protein PilO [Thalassotalea ponticola]
MKNIDLSELNDLDLNNIGQWPALAKGILAIVLVVFVSYFVYYLMVSDKITTLEQEVAREQKLKTDFEAKYYVSANLELFREQMEEAEELFSNQIKRLPESHETPGLLDDITFVGTTSGLDFKKLNWQPEIQQEFYVELPIKVQVVGSYHDFGEFVSKISGLPRIVTLHDFSIVNETAGKDDKLTLTLQAKTYRYREADK